MYEGHVEEYEKDSSGGAEHHPGHFPGACGGIDVGEDHVGTIEFWDDLSAEELPYYYQSWYLPLVEAGKAMPDSINASMQ